MHTRARVGLFHLFSLYTRKHTHSHAHHNSQMMGKPKLNYEIYRILIRFTLKRETIYGRKLCKKIPNSLSRSDEIERMARSCNYMASRTQHIEDTFNKRRRARSREKKKCGRPSSSPHYQIGKR